MKQQTMKKNPMSKMMKTAILDLPTPSSLSFLWNMGFLLGMILMLQITTGIFLSMMYTSQTEYAFTAIVMMMRDINAGWLTRMFHMNGASLMFMTMYLHLARGLYFSSYTNKPKVWATGMILLLATMATAFLGYVLPWGQMSFWGATVITGVLSAIPICGNDLVTWIWGGPSISQPTLTRFFSLHFMMPMLMVTMVMAHLIFLHENGSSNPSNTNTNTDKVKFNPFFSLKDIIPMVAVILVLTMMVSNTPNLLGDSENFNPANPMTAPLHIQPEWYFLFAYVILRSIPSKLGGVLMLMLSVMIMSVLIFKKSKTSKFSISKKTKIWFLASIILILTWIGTKTVESPFDSIGQLYTFLYFIVIILL